MAQSLNSEGTGWSGDTFTPGTSSTNTLGYMSGIGYGFSAIASALGAYRSSSAQKIADTYQANIAAINQQIDQWSASAAITKGQTAEQASDLQTASMISKQRVGMAANGVDIAGSASSLDVLASTQFVGNVNAAQIHDNAMRDAWGFSVAGTNASNQQAFYNSAAAGINPTTNALTAGFGTAATASARWYSSYNNGTFAPPSSSTGSI